MTLPFLPNEAAATYLDQAEPDSQDFEYLLAGDRLSGVVSGCAVTESSPTGMSVDVAAGVVRYLGREVTTSATPLLAIPAADPSNGRFDVIFWRETDGTIAVQPGIPLTNPELPPLSVDGVALAAVYVPAGTGQIFDADIQDKRITLPAAAVFSIRDYGAVGDDTADDAAAIQAAIDAASVVAGTVLFPPSATPYLANTNIVMKANVRIVGYGATLRRGDDTDLQGTIDARSVNGWSIEGLTIDGNRAGMTTSEHKHCLWVQQCDGWMLRDVLFTTAMGDGLFIRGDNLGDSCNDFACYNVICDDHRRNALSVVSARRGKFVACRFINTIDGTAPKSGIDIEPNVAADHIDDLSFIDCEVRGNTNSGVNVVLSVAPTGVQKGVRFIGGSISDNGLVGVFIDPGYEITLNGVDIVGNDNDNVTVKGASRDVTVNGCRIIGSVNASGVSVRPDAASEDAVNVQIINNTILDNDNYGVNVAPTGGGTVNGVIVIGNRSGNQTTSTQLRGYYSSGGATVTNETIVGNDLRNNTAPLTLGGQLASLIIHSNQGAETSVRGIRMPGPVFNVFDYGATGDGTTDDTATAQAALTAGAGAVVVFPPGVYRCAGLTVPDDTTVLLYGAKLERQAISGSAVLSLGARCRVEGGELDGRNLTGGAKIDVGLEVAGVDCLVNGVTSHDNYADGIRLDTADRSRITNCTTYDNGTNPGALGTGDGFFVLNTDDAWIDKCDARNNARTGIVVTTFDGAGLDATLSNRVRINSCRSEGNGYNDVNTEGVTGPVVNDLWSAGAVAASFSNGGQFSGVRIADGGFYAEDHDNLHVSHFDIKKANSNGAFFVTGLRPRISDIKILGTTGPHTANAFEVHDVTDELGTINNVHVDGANNAVFIEGIVTASGFDVQNVGNVRFWVKHGGQSSRSMNDLESITKSLVRALHPVIPTGGFWFQGDIVHDPTPSAGGSIGWVCTASGAPGTWKTYGSIAP